MTVEASPQLIWRVLMDEETYPQWNRILIPIKGEIEEGNKLKYNLIPPKGDPIEIEMKVKALIPYKLLNQYGGVPGLFTYNHRYQLQHEGVTTRVIIHEDFKGIGVLFIDLAWLQQAYAALNQSLRSQALELAKQEK